MSTPWDEIDAWLANHAPAVLANLHAPIENTSAIDVLNERLHPYALPASLLDFWRAHDGTRRDTGPLLLSAATGTPWVQSFALLSADEARKEHWAICDLGVGWRVHDVPFAKDGGGNYLYLDARSGEVRAWDHEASSMHVFSSFSAWIEEMRDAMQSGRVVPNDSDEPSDAGPLVRRHSTSEEPAAPPADHGARVLLEWLLERELLQLVEGTGGESLVGAMQRALNAGPQALATLFETHPSIEDCFLDDDALETLAEEFG